MSRDAWDPPENWPPGHRMPKDEASGEVIFLTNRRGELLLYPFPFGSSEMELWKLPPAAILFPLHPVYVADLFGKAIEKFDALDLGDFQPSLSELTRPIWLECLTAFRPGGSIRAACERLFIARTEPSAAAVSKKANETRRLELLARHLVLAVLLETSAHT